MAYEDFKDLFRRIASVKIIKCDKAFNIAKNTTYDVYQKSAASVVYKFSVESPLSVVLLKMKACQTKN